MESSRKSRRLQEKPDTARYTLQDTDDDDDTADNSVKVPKARAATGNGTTVPRTGYRKKKGLLAQLTEFPLDVLFEIFSYLSPHDLVRLTRTTKSLRDILLQRSCIFLWKLARSNVEGLPDVPDDMTEPAYASLAFDTFCHDCMAPNVKNIAWSIRKRLCQNCLNTNRYTPYWHGHVINYDSLQELRSCLWSFGVTVRNGRRGSRTMRMYSMVNINEVRNQFLGLDPSARQEWATERRRLVAAREDHERQAKIWESTIKEQHGEELDAVRKKRREDIVQKLIDLGHGDVLEKLKTKRINGHPNPLDVLKNVNVARKLTNGDWNKIMPPIVERLDQLKKAYADHEASERKRNRFRSCETAVKQYLDSLPFNHVGPRLGDIAQVPSISAILFDSSPDSEITPEDFADAVLEIPHFSEEWRVSKDQELLKLLGPEASMDTLTLATTFFQCERCSKPISYPRILVHQCIIGHSYPYPEDTKTRECYLYFDTVPWSIKRIKINSEIQECMSDIVRQSGLDPSTASFADLEAAYPVFRKSMVPESSCNSDQLVSLRNLVAYDVPFTSWSKYTRADDPEMIDLVKAEDIKRFSDRDFWSWASLSTKYQCRHCEDVFTRTDLLSHCRDAHNIEAVAPWDVVFLLDSPHSGVTLSVPIPVVPEPSENDKNATNAASNNTSS